MVSTLEEWGYYGVFKYVCRVSRFFGIFPLKMSPEPKVSTWLKYYGLFFILPFINILFVYFIYGEIKESSSQISSMLYIIYITSSLLCLNVAVWTASSRIYAWLLCLRNIEKIIRTRKTDKKELFKCILSTVYFLEILFSSITHSVDVCRRLDKGTYICVFHKVNISILDGMCTTCDSFLFMILIFRIHTATKIMNEELNKLLHEGDVDKRPILRNNYMIGSSFKAYKCSHGAEKVRELSNTYMTISEVIKTVMETGEVVIFLYIMSKLARLMTRVYNYAHWHFAFQDVSFDYHVIITSIIEIFWCTQTVVKLFLYCEGPHQIHSMMQETQDLVAKLKKKYQEDNVSNELHLFLRLTMLSRPTFSPLNVFTLNRGLVAKILACTATYFVAFMQLDINRNLNK